MPTRHFVVPWGGGSRAKGFVPVEVSDEEAETLDSGAGTDEAWRRIGGRLLTALEEFRAIQAAAESALGKYRAVPAAGTSGDEGPLEPQRHAQEGELPPPVR
jgi:hypothetical protein